MSVLGTFGLESLAQLLLGQSWKKLARTLGEAEAKSRLHVALLQRTQKDAASRVSQWEKDGWSWEAAADQAFLDKHHVQIDEQDKALGPGFVLVRDGLYRIIRDIGVPGGKPRDIWRDAVDNKVFAIASQYPDWALNQPLKNLDAQIQRAFADLLF